MRRGYLALARAGFAAMAAVSAALAAGPAAAQTPIRVAVEGSLTGPAAPLVAAQDRGYYRTEKLDVSIDATGGAPDAITRVATGAAEFALADINMVIKYRDQNPGAPLKAVFMVYNKPPYAVIARKSRGIANPKDLEGKRIGAPATDAAGSQWPLFAKLNNIDASKVKVESIAPAVREPMLAAGQVDAVTGISFSTYLNLKERGVPVDDLVVLAMADYGVQLYGDAIVMNTKFALESPEAVRAFLRAYLAGLKTTIREPARAVDSVVKRNEVANKNLELERLRMAIHDNILTEEVQANGLGGVDPARLAKAIDQLSETHKFRSKPEPSEVFDPTYLPPEPERRVGPRARPG